MASLSPAHPPARGLPSVPWLPTRPSPRAAFSRTQAGTVQGAGRDNRAPFVAGVWGCHWWPGVGGEGTAGPGGERGAQGWRCGWRIPEPGRAASSPHPCGQGTWGTPASDGRWGLDSPPGHGGGWGTPQRVGDPSSCDVGLTLFLPRGGPLRPETRPGVRSALSHLHDSSSSSLT